MVNTQALESSPPYLAYSHHTGSDLGTIVNSPSSAPKLRHGLPPDPREGSQTIGPPSEGPPSLSPPKENDEGNSNPLVVVDNLGDAAD